MIFWAKRIFREFLGDTKSTGFAHGYYYYLVLLYELYKPRKYKPFHDDDDAMR